MTSKNVSFTILYFRFYNINAPQVNSFYVHVKFGQYLYYRIVTLYTCVKMFIYY